MTEDQIAKDKMLVEEAIVSLIIRKVDHPDDRFIETLPELLRALIDLWFAF